MKTYIARRLLLFIPSLLGVSIIIFVIMRVVPGDVALAILAGDGAAVSQEALIKLRHELDLDRPLYIQYLDWIWALLRGDLGDSLVRDTAVAEIIKTTFPVTAELAFLALLVTLGLAVPVGVLSAVKQDTPVDYLVRIFAIAGLAMPIFWTSILIIYFLVLCFNWMPPLEYAGLWDNPSENLQQYVFPALALGYYHTAIVARMTRSCMLEVLREDYVRTARAKGLRERLVIGRHALKNAVLPVVTVAGWQFGRMLGGTVIIEAIFGLPGIGRILIESIHHRDYPVIQALLLLMAVAFLFMNLMVDLVYGWLDPRIRYT